MAENNAVNEHRKKLIVEELQNLHNTMNKISTLWGYDDVMDKDLNISAYYPFKESFDELTFKVEVWVEKVKEEYLKK